jgi:hypothetical protein
MTILTAEVNVNIESEPTSVFLVPGHLVTPNLSPSNPFYLTCSKYTTESPILKKITPVIA